MTPASGATTLDEETAQRPVVRTEVVVIGAGLSGIASSVQLQRGGFDHVVLEKGPDVGGTWLANQYPGCRCDVPSHLYSFSFAPNPEWTTTFAAQPEILEYLQGVSRKFHVYEHCRFDEEVLEARYDDTRGEWDVRTSQANYRCDVVIAAFGLLSAPSVPLITGLEHFEGRVVHSAMWEAGELFDGESVAVVGTGASAIQLVPQVQPHVAALHVFQRTPAWVLPHPNRDIRDVERRLYRHFPVLQKAVRIGVYWLRELFAYGLCRAPKRLETARKMALDHLESQVDDPELRAKLTPSYTPGCKRITIANDYFPAISAANAELVTEAISEVEPHGIRTTDGVSRTVDTIVLATGFQPTNHPVAHRIFGRAGSSLADDWDHEGMRAYLGTSVAGFPNLFFLAGPNTGIGHTSLVFMVESQLRYVMDALRARRARGAVSIEVTPEAQAKFNEELRHKMPATVWASGHCTSWYLDSKGRNTTLWPDFTWRFGLRTRRLDVSDHRLTWKRPGAIAASGPNDGAAAPKDAQTSRGGPPSAAASAGGAYLRSSR